MGGIDNSGFLHYLISHYLSFIFCCLHNIPCEPKNKFSMSGELPRFQAGVTMEISRLDAWYSSADGSLEGPATYIVRGLCRRCCVPEIVLRCMQVMNLGVLA